MTRDRNVHLFAVLFALGQLGSPYAHARVTTRSGSTYVVEMQPSRTIAYTDSAAIGRRDLNIKDAYIHEGRLHLVGCDPKDSVITSPVESVSISSQSIVQVPTPQDHLVDVIAGAFGAR